MSTLRRLICTWNKENQTFLPRLASCRCRIMHFGLQTHRLCLPSAALPRSILSMRQSHICFCVLCAILGLALTLGVLLLGPSTAAAQQAPAPKAPISFINDVAPILKENCFACHD